MSIREEFIRVLVEIDEGRAIELVEKRIDGGEDILTILKDVREASEIIGEKFENGEYFVSDLILAGEMLNKIMEIIRPKMERDKSRSAGKVVMGTVEGDIHDIGKNIVIALLEAEGFEVIDLGVDVPPEEFVRAIRENSPHVVGLSGLLSESVESMKKIVEKIEEAGLRENLKIIIGGGAVDERAKEYVSADEWADDASAGVKKIKRLVEELSKENESI
ncbi:MAG: corrinoid protein [Archaeoglobi archaeon]|nr:corrinoid protein [Candidatus Mnemosynella sp.]